MKILAAVMALFAVIYFLPAFTMRTHAINGANQKTALHSARDIKRTLSTNDRVIFDTAFGILFQIKSKEGEKAFLEAVDGKSSDEIVELAKHEVNVRIAAGDPDFKKYTSWDNMIEALTEGEKKPGKDAEDAQPLRNSSRTGRPE